MRHLNQICFLCYFLFLNCITFGSTYAQEWALQEPTQNIVKRRVIAGMDVPFDFKCEPGYRIMSGGYEVLAIEGGVRNDVDVLASTVDVPNNRYHVKLSHNLPYTGGAHPLISARISGLCFILPNVPNSVLLPEYVGQQYSSVVKTLANMNLTPVHAGGSLERGQRRITNCVLEVWYPVIERTEPKAGNKIFENKANVKLFTKRFEGTITTSTTDAGCQ